MILHYKFIHLELSAQDDIFDSKEPSRTLSLIFLHTQDKGAELNLFFVFL